MNIEIPKEELTLLKAQTTKATSTVNDLIIDSNESMVKATELLSKIKLVSKLISKEKDKLLIPARTVVDNIRKFFKPFEDSCESAEKILKDKMVKYQTAEEDKARKKIEVIENKVANGKINMEDAEEKISALEVQDKIESKSGSAKFRINKVVNIVDESLLPREFMIPDMVRIRKVALEGYKIPGVEVVEQKIVAGLTK